MIEALKYEKGDIGELSKAPSLALIEDPKTLKDLGILDSNLNSARDVRTPAFGSAEKGNLPL